MDYKRWKAEIDVRYERMKSDVRDLLDRAKTKTGQVRDDLAPHAEKLAAKRERLAQKLDDAKDRGEAGFEAIRGGVEKAWDDLKDAFEEFHQKMGGKPKED